MKKLLVIISALSIAMAACAMDIDKQTLDTYIANQSWALLSDAIGQNIVNLYDLLSYDASALAKKNTTGVTLCDQLVYFLATHLVITHDDRTRRSTSELGEKATAFYIALENLVCAGKITLPTSVTDETVDKTRADLCSQYCNYIRNKAVLAQQGVPGYITATNWSELAAFMTANRLPPQACTLSLSQEQNVALIEAFNTISKNNPTSAEIQQYINHAFYYLTRRQTFTEPSANPKGPTTSFLSFTPKTYIAAGAVAIAGLLIYSYYRTLAQG